MSRGRSDFYRCEPRSCVPIPDPEAHELIRAEGKRLGIAPREIDDAEIIERIFYAASGSTYSRTTCERCTGSPSQMTSKGHLS